ncbi:methyltransferase regulatory domain-containing protein [Rhodobacteraceae bacterium 2376]|uniref:Methyltransferase regulatory domain-containing protein n=1 Tax=Rhabdonatronobacter sediminivivens TaxID=2743469 RepID=A0A7Z0I181_9RHOB|nr:class I SAM-dependent methyltransferase [Rhabdonatronobacter sediminivivens]NYS26067.1 methyltransferase regulatory domain-containing protein [Rhabdonatronobacter sediminivivens]
MSDWTGGYVADIEYLPGVFEGQGPGNLDLACIMAGIEPVRRPGSNAPFTYCDLGCGQASTVSALAAANPDAQFWGIDFMPAHIARAEAFRREAGLDNLTLIEADVVALAGAAETDLPRFDYIALHGLYTWVSEEVRAGIVAFLDRFLKPGGAAYIGYNVMPGWTTVAPLQKLLFEYGATRQGPSGVRVTEAIDFARQMKAVGAEGLDALDSQRMFPTGMPPELEQRHLGYLAHEFLNTGWRPRFHIDVARDLSAAKMEFAGSAQLLDNFAGINLSDEAEKMLAMVPAGPLRETFEDYFTGRRFRRDIFVRGRRNILAETREAMLADVILALVNARPDPDQSEWPQLSTRFTLNRQTYDPVFDRLEQGPASIGELCAAAQGAGRRTTGNELLGMLAGLDLALPVLHDVAGSVVESCWRHNRVVTQAAYRSVRSTRFPIAAPVGHTVLAFNALQTLILDGLFSGIPAEVDGLSAHVIARLKLDPDAVQQLPEAGAPGESPQPSPAPDAQAATDDTPAPPPEPRRVGEAVRSSTTDFLEYQLPIWRQLGILPPIKPE